MKKDQVDIIIVNYFALELLKTCIGSIVEPDLHIRIIILDNHTDGRKLEVLRNHTNLELHFFYAEENIGFTAGCNLAFQKLKEELGPSAYALFLNPDTHLSKNDIGKLLETLKSYDADLIYPKSVYPDGEHYCSGTNLDILKMRMDNLSFRDEKAPILVDFYQGSAFLVKTDVYEKVGGMDGKLFMYFDEADLSYRLRQAGYKILYDPMVTIIHDASYSFKGNHYRKAYYIARNGVYIFSSYSKDKSFRKTLTFFYNHVLVVMFWWYLKTARFKSIAFGLKGILHARKGVFGKLKE